MIKDIECRNFKSMQKGALQGFADLFFPEVGFGIKGYQLFQKNGRRWVNAPSKEFTNQQGEKAFAPYQFYDDREANDEFTKRALDAIDDFCQIETSEPSAYQPPYKDEDVPF